MIYKYKKLSILLLCTSLNLLSGQECDSGYVWVEDVPISCGGAENCFFEADLNLLQEIIDNSGETINTIMDDNGGSPYLWNITLRYDDAQVFYSHQFYKMGVSIRCLQD